MKNYYGNERFGFRAWGWRPFKDVDIDGTLDYLHEHLPLKNWILSGGIAVDLICGRETRPRLDIDLCVPFESLQEAVENYKEDSEYVLQITHFRLPSPIKRDLVESPRHITMGRITGKHVKFVSRKYLEGDQQGIEDVLDIFTFADGRDLTKGVDLRSIIADRFIHTTRGGNQTPVYGSRYQSHLKNIWRRRKDLIDLSSLAGAV